MLTTPLNRRSLIALPIAASLSLPLRQQPVPGRAGWQFPIGWPGEVPADGFSIRHGYACENTWFNPGWWHTGEDWYALDDAETAGAAVLAIGPGEVVYADFDYPGRVVIVQHADDLFSMYGHLDDALDVAPGDAVTAGDRLGTVLRREDGRAPSHLHVEVRTFLTTPAVNGDAPRYGVNCGVDCPPGPGYWPIDAPEHPSALGWRNPTHVIAHRLASDAEIVVARGAGDVAPLWSAPADEAGAEGVGELPLTPGDRYRVLAVAAGDEASDATSAEGYRLWYRIEAPGVGEAWVRGAAPSTHDTGSDGRPSSVVLPFVPVPGA